MVISVQVAAVALTVAQEAGGESEEGKLAVAYVIKNRAAGSAKACSDVVFKPYQFSCWNTESSTRMNLDEMMEQVWAGSVVAALQAMYRLVEDPTKGAVFYLNEETVMDQVGELPNWWFSDTDPDSEIKIGNHTFRRRKK